ncbi:MAG: DUF2164 domain-containing protein [Paenibacillaceae bacterium]
MIIYKLPKEHKDELTKRVQAYFYEERSEEIGSIAAGSILDFMLKELGPVIYNQAIFDARKLVKEKMDSLENDLYSIEQPLDLKGR